MSFMKMLNGGPKPEPSGIPFNCATKELLSFEILTI